MTLLQGLAPSSLARLGSSVLSAALAALLILFAAACEGEAGKEPAATSEAPARESPAAETPGAASDGVAPSASPEERTATAPTLVTTYSSPTCGCCHEYERYLEAEGFEVESIRTANLTEIKDGLGIPADMRSCHTTIIQDYFVEGHVPVEAIRKLLDERPQIDGIALPGMPSGSPGMGGTKAQPFTVYSIGDGRVDEFVTL